MLSGAWGQKPPLTLDDFFSSVEIRSLQISPDGHEVVIETVRRVFRITVTAVIFGFIAILAQARWFSSHDPGMTAGHSGHRMASP